MAAACKPMVKSVLEHIALRTAIHKASTAYLLKNAYPRAFWLAAKQSFRALRDFSLIRLSLMILFGGLALVAHAETLNGRISAISDGDALILVDATNRQHPIRLLGIDAPDLGQDFSQPAKTALSALAFNQTANADCRLRDRRMREVCIVQVGALDLGLALIAAGAAWNAPQHSAQLTPLERGDYEHAEFNAKIRRFGLWNSKNPMPPWDWRRRQGVVDE